MSDLTDHRFAQVCEDFDWLVANGETPTDAAKRVGVVLDSLIEQRRRADRKAGR